MRGDTIIFATDGVQRNFVDSLAPHDSAQQLADRILAHHSKGSDDALVLVARYKG
jgi:phosphoserine phosphatase RsbX